MPPRLATLDFEEIVKVQHPPLTAHITFAPFVEDRLKERKYQEEARSISQTVTYR